jgi:BMFP domain-containing protein YqiC
MNIIRFQKLKFKIYDFPPEDDVLEKFPELAKYEVIKKLRAPKKNLLIRYIIFLYDPGSDLIREVSDLSSRKKHAADLAGYQDSDNLRALFDCTDEALLTLLDCFFKEIYHNRKYREWQTLTQELDEYTRLRWEQIDGKTGKKRKTVTTDDEGKKKVDYDDIPEDIDKYKAATEKTKLREQCDKIHASLDALEREIFGDHEDVKTVALKTRYMTPENFAGIIKYA